MTSDVGVTIEIRELGAECIELIGEIDRSEHIERRYTVKDGRLCSERVEFEVPPWDSEGHGDHSSARRITEFRPIVESGAALLGAFIDELIAGIAIVDPVFEERIAWFAFLHVSRAYRRSGVASALWAAGAQIAADAGATSIYVSATPSGSAVGFYTSRGCRLAAPPHPALFAKEPEDIHLTCPITQIERSSARNPVAGSLESGC
jgi:GNAT superfamily N-acetyltransferase